MTVDVIKPRYGKLKPSNRKVVVTGGAGYVGSHVVLKLLKAGYVPVILDNFSNSSPSAVGRLKEISRREIEVVDMDIRDASALASLLPRIQPWAVIHCAPQGGWESGISPLCTSTKMSAARSLF